MHTLVMRESRNLTEDPKLNDIKAGCKSGSNALLLSQEFMQFCLAARAQRQSLTMLCSRVLPCVL